MAVEFVAVDVKGFFVPHSSTSTGEEPSIVVTLLLMGVFISDEPHDEGGAVVDPSWETALNTADDVSASASTSTSAVVVVVIVVSVNAVTVVAADDEVERMAGFATVVPSTVAVADKADDDDNTEEVKWVSVFCC